MPSVGNYRQGMLVSVPLHLDDLPGKPKGADLHAALSKYYADSQHVLVMPLDRCSFQRRTYRAGGVERDQHARTLCVFQRRRIGRRSLVARLDNLGKGASGAAVQNMRLMLGLS